ncbi:MAG: hypothetical protein IIU08_11135, partial [Clostridia bacterium]|nr:hypothetical protein [Clostridia bacterium]
LGKKEDGKYFLFQNAKWVPDENHVIMDLLVGFDPSEPEDSPYRFGSGTVFDIDSCSRTASPSRDSSRPPSERCRARRTF